MKCFIQVSGSRYRAYHPDVALCILRTGVLCWELILLELKPEIFYFKNKHQLHFPLVYFLVILRDYIFILVKMHHIVFIVNIFLS